MSSPKPSRWGRMGGVVRRASSVLAVSRPTTPSPSISERDTDSTSITKQRVDTNPPILTPPVPAVVHQAPSPIAESPQREAEAAEEAAAPLGPSPLAQENSVSKASTPEPILEMEEAASPSGYVPPPLIDSSAGNPGAFTDEPETLPQPEVIRDPYASSSRVDLSAPQGTDTRPASVHEAADIEELTAPTHAEEQTVQEGVHREFDNSPAYFEKPTVESIADRDTAEEVHPAFSEAVYEDATIVEPIAAPVEAEPQGSNIEYYHPEMPLPSHHDSEATAISTSAPVFSLPAYDMNLGQEVWGGASQKPESTREVFMPTGNGHASSNQAQSIGMPVEDPFSNPIAPRIAISHSDASHLSHPESAPQHRQQPYESHEDVSGAIVMPLPALHDVIVNKSIHQMPSTSSFSLARGNYETDETRPLLSLPGTPRATSYLQPSTHNHVNVSPISNPTWVPTTAGTGNLGNAPRLHELGWLEYHLPDGTFYYVHPTRRITTDVNLRLDKMLAAVAAFLDSPASFSERAGPSSAKDSSAPGIEVWLRDFGTAKKGFVPIRCWVDHHARTVTMDRVQDGGKGKKVAEEDQLDMEFRYWSFMEAHPAHTTLPAKAKAEAMDVLTWAWTDRLLPSHRAIPAPFTQEECQELMTLLRSFASDNHDDHGIQTRIVSRILLRVALWRQMYFRPNKPLPKDVSSNQLHLPTPRRPLRRALFDFVVSCVCLGIPYLFLERTRNNRLDEESGLRSAGPVFIIGACTCLVAAIVLSASVTFLSLPGLDSVARTAGLVAILFASFSMASTLVAIFKQKADMERAVSFVGLEGLMNISRRAVILSLPLVFLTYSIIGFITGITLYSLRGTSLIDPSLIQNRFEDYTRWTVVGVLGALAGMLTTSYLVARRA